MTTSYSYKQWSPAVDGSLLHDPCGELYVSHSNYAPPPSGILHLESSFSQMDFSAISRTAMEQMNALPSVEWFVSALRDCALANDIACVRHINTHLCSNGLEVLANHVTLALAECGGLQEAQQVFDKFFLANEYCWSALIKGLAQHGELEDALNLLQKMEEQGVESNKGMLVALVQACTRLRCVETGWYAHSEVAKEGFEKDVFVGSALVDMYGKCDQILEAQDVFNELSCRDTVAWTALIGGYGEHGLGSEALKCMEEMRVEGISPDASTYVCVLKACGSIEMAQSLHVEILKAGYERSQFVGSSLVYIYAKSGLLADAKGVLGGLSVEGSAAWNALIAGYIDRELAVEALGCYEEMIWKKICPSASTFVCGLKACGIVRSLEKGQELHAEVLKRGYETVSFVGNSLVYLYGMCGALTEAQEIFNRLEIQNDVSWNTLITCFVELDFGMEALQVAENMLSKQVHGGVATFLCCLKACGSIRALEKGYSIHSQIICCGQDSLSLIGNALVDMFSRCGALAEAQEVFNTLPIWNVVSWNSLIAGYARHGHGIEAYRCLGEMQLEDSFPDVVSWNSVILGFAEQGEHEKAHEPYARMQEQGLLPDYITYVNISSLCGNNISLELGKRLHTQISGHGAFSADFRQILTNALMEMYGCCGSLADMQRLFDAAISRNDVTWNALITGYARHGELSAVLHHFERMLEAGVKPCEITFVSILTACSHLGMRGRAIHYFEHMHFVYCLTPTVFHYNCLVDLFVRSGQIEEAALILQKLPFMPDLVVWNTILGAFDRWNVSM